jgi:ankyrin repeat protein
MTTPHDRFLLAATVPVDGWHGGGDLAEAQALLAAHPELLTQSIHAAAVWGDSAAVTRFLQHEPALVNALGGPRGWDPLTHLCFSRFLRLDPSRSEGLVASARHLLAAGANPNTGWNETLPEGRVFLEAVMYGAAGIAQHPGLTQLLLDHGADPNDEETPYHVPETYDLAVLQILLDSGRFTAESLSTVLLRKCDWHDVEGVRLALRSGADPNRQTRWGRTAFHQAVIRNNPLAIVEAMLDHKADPTLPFHGTPGFVLAAREGRGDILQLLQQRGWSLEFHGVDRLLAACALGDASQARGLAAEIFGAQAPDRAEVGRWLGRFANSGDPVSMATLLDVVLAWGISVDAEWPEGLDFMNIPRRSTPLQVAAWRARHAVVALLVEHGADVHRKDPLGRTPLDLAMKACVDSWWTDRRTTESIATLLAAGADPSGLALPTGYPAADLLLQRR